jgi:hypothetical protein
VWRDEKDLALHWLGARLQHDTGLTNVKLNPLARSLRTDLRYAEFPRPMSLPPD